MRSKKQASTIVLLQPSYEGSVEQESQRLQEEGGLNKDLKTRIQQDEEIWD